MKIVIFTDVKKSLYIAWAGFRNVTVSDLRLSINSVFDCLLSSAVKLKRNIRRKSSRVPTLYATKYWVGRSANLFIFHLMFLQKLASF